MGRVNVKELICNLETIELLEWCGNNYAKIRCKTHNIELTVHKQFLARNHKCPLCIRDDNTKALMDRIHRYTLSHKNNPYVKVGVREITDVNDCRNKYHDLFYVCGQCKSKIILEAVKVKNALDNSTTLYCPRCRSTEFREMKTTGSVPSQVELSLDDFEHEFDMTTRQKEPKPSKESVARKPVRDKVSFEGVPDELIVRDSFGRPIRRKTAEELEGNGGYFRETAEDLKIVKLHDNMVSNIKNIAELIDAEYNKAYNVIFKELDVSESMKLELHRMIFNFKLFSKRIKATLKYNDDEE